MKKNNNYFFVSRFRIQAIAESNIRIPGFKGFSLRDCFQQALSLYSGCPDTFAVDACQRCRKSGKCLYQSFFRASVPEDNPTARAFKQNPPAAFAFDPLDLSKSNYEQGDSFVFDILLFGNTVKYIKKLVDVFRLMGETGIGSRSSAFGQRGLFSIESVVNIGIHDQKNILDADNKIIPQFKPSLISLNSFSDESAFNHQIVLNFIHPLTIISKNKLLFNELNFNDIKSSLINRIVLLSNFYCNKSFQDVNSFFQSYQSSEGEITSAKLHLHTYRYSSSRQKKIIRYKALRGQIFLKNISLNDFKLLKLGEHIFIGRNTSSGFGKYILEK
ncbi:MAG: hypothetical protein GX437_13080 [Sphingobacteriales bacterium]|nr:hypothetical protein [Sphingobacteriales bacterium]